MGLGTESFTYQTLANTLAVVGCGVCIVIVDKVGRRPLLIAGTVLTVIFNVVIAACGSGSPPSPTATRAVIASFILLLGASRMSLGSLSCEFAIVYARTRIDALLRPHRGRDRWITNAQEE